jgi:hypothetical protein
MSTWKQDAAQPCGLYQQHGDQVGENAALVAVLCAAWR